ncbi:NAD(P)-binding protein [Jackrogersella minutella]|nr:NAD(P)-binding protein [Jackrogersella minutella]
MPSYVITGVSRGLGFEFLRQLSKDPSAVVIGLARDKAATEKKVAANIGRSNIHILHGDMVNYESLKKAAEDVSKITGGRLDYLIANAAIISDLTAFSTLHDHVDDHEALEEDLLSSYKTNVVGNIHLFNLFLPLIRKGEAKKIISISTGMADIDLVSKFDIDTNGPYAMSKIALNLAVAKYSVEFRSEGILFMSISPGVVDTGNLKPEKLSEKDLKGLHKMLASFAQYAPHFKGPMTEEESIRQVLNVINNASVERGDSGSFVSHFGDKQWL